MAKNKKWFAGILGWTLGGPIGGMIGFALGTFLDSQSSSVNEYVKSSQGKSANDFEMSLLVLSSIVIKADGKVQQSELDFVRNHFIKLFGKERANLSFKMFNEMMKEEVSLQKVCTQIRQYMPHASRLQLIHFLFGLANADGHVHETELRVIQTTANYFNINVHDFESLKAMFFKSVDASYKILEIDTNVSDDELKKAYRKMAKKFHPDRVAHLGEALQGEANEKFKKVQEAYESIRKERGIA
jgi:DnaJ like chaperone protein